MHVMTPEEYRAFMMEGTRTAMLTTVRADGRPHIAPVWFLLDGDAIMFMTGEETVKGRNIRRDGRVAIGVDEPVAPYSFVLVEGQAEIVDPAPGELLQWSTRIAGRYMGPELAEQYGKRNAVPGELLIRVDPAKIIARKNIAD